MVGTKKRTQDSDADKKITSRRASRTKSPARKSSPSRSARTETKRSPGRPTRSRGLSKSPARKSPSRTKAKSESSPKPSTRATTPKARAPIKSASRTPPRATKELTALKPTGYWEIDDSDSDDTPIESYQPKKPQAIIKGSARKLDEYVEKVHVRNVEPPTASVHKRITRSSQNRELERERVVHLRHFDTARRIGELSDDDFTYSKKSENVEKVPTEFKPVTEFGGWLGALFLMLSFPITVMLIYISCNEHQCSFTKIPHFGKFAHIGAFFNLTSLLGYITYVVLLAILSIIPFGGKTVTGLPTKQGRYVYVMNGLSSFIILLGLLCVLEWQKISIVEFVTNHIFHLVVDAFIVGFFITIYVYIRSFYVPFSALNVHTVGHHPIYQFFLGKELNPRVFQLLDLKMYIFRLGVITPMLLNFIFLYEYMDIKLNPQEFNWKSINFEPTAVLLVAMQTIYLLDPLIVEETWLTSFEIQYEAFGYMSAVGYSLYPYMMVAVTKYVIDYHVQLATWKLAIIGVTFLIGYILFRCSNNQKDAFRKNPYDPALSHLETIPTTKGKKLICSGFWGVVRHPNYLGDILINSSIIPFVATVPPVITFWSIIVLLIHRSVRDNTRCKQKYGPAWDRYCSKVKYVLIPKVY